MRITKRDGNVIHVQPRKRLRISSITWFLLSYGIFVVFILYVIKKLVT